LTFALSVLLPRQVGGSHHTVSNGGRPVSNNVPPARATSPLPCNFPPAKPPHHQTALNLKPRNTPAAIATPPNRNPPRKIAPPENATPKLFQRPNNSEGSCVRALPAAFMRSVFPPGFDLSGSRPFLTRRRRQHGGERDYVVDAGAGSSARLTRR
jgi:hypothetical protein